MQLWTQESSSKLPFYKNLTKLLMDHIETFFPGVSCSLVLDKPANFNLEYLESNNLVRTRVRTETNRKQINTGDIFDFIIRNRYQPSSNTALFILTDADLYPQEGWTYVFGVTRASLRTLIQSIARHDPCFPEISKERLLSY